MKVGPKSSLRPFLHRALQLFDKHSIIFQGSYSHEKSWNFKMHFPGLEKS